MTKNPSNVPASRDTDNNPRHADQGELLYMMHELSRLISVYFDHAMQEYGITRSQWWTLMHVAEHEGKSQSELARIMQMGRASAGKLIEKLEEKGWIERRADPNDSRVLQLFLKPDGQPILEAMRKEGENQFRDLLSEISQEEEQALLKGLRKIKASAEAATQRQR